MAIKALDRLGGAVQRAKCARLRMYLYLSHCLRH